MSKNILERATLLLAAGFVLATFPRPVQALPTFSGGHADCLSCHDTPKEAATGPSLVTAHPGDTVPLSIDITDGTDNYSISLAGLDAAGLAGFVPDATWVDHFSPGTFDSTHDGPFYALSDTGVAFSGPVTQSFNLQLAPATALGIYDLTFFVSGLLESEFETWRDVNGFQLEVVPEPSTLVMLSLGGLLIGSPFYGRRRRR